MTDPDLPGDSKTESLVGLDSWQQSFQWLRNMFVVVLILLVVLSLSFNLHLLRQVMLVNRQLNETRPGIQRMVAEYQGKTVPFISMVLSNFQAFAKTSPDFGSTVLNKYLGTNSPPVTAAPLAPQTKPATTNVSPAGKAKPR
jgi:hypothetical protein